MYMLKIDKGLCQVCGSCEKLLVRKIYRSPDGLYPVTDGNYEMYKEKVKLAMKQCPAQAISIEDIKDGTIRPGLWQGNN